MESHKQKSSNLTSLRSLLDLIPCPSHPNIVLSITSKGPLTYLTTPLFQLLPVKVSASGTRRVATKDIVQCGQRYGKRNFLQKRCLQMEIYSSKSLQRMSSKLQLCRAFHDCLDPEIRRCDQVMNCRKSTGTFCVHANQPRCRSSVQACIPELLNKCTSETNVRWQLTN